MVAGKIQFYGHSANDLDFFSIDSSSEETIAECGTRDLKGTIVFSLKLITTVKDAKS